MSTDERCEETRELLAEGRARRRGRPPRTGAAVSRSSRFRIVDGTWGGSLPRDLGALAAIHLVDADGRPVLVARF
jgi:hypothetical protein